MRLSLLRLLFIGVIILVPLLTISPPVRSQDNVPSVNDFLYQLQNTNLTAIGESAYDLIIIDYSTDGSDESAFTLEEIEALKDSPGGEKIVLAYMSIGEAEDYRFYWQDDWEPGTPAWLDKENPDWEGNYKVRYWEPDWQSIIFGRPDSYLNKIIAAGFDGVYLDIIDAYYFYEKQGYEDAAQEMVDFVIALANYAREDNPDFIIVPQNAVELVSDFPEYLVTINGVGQEDIFYGYPDDQRQTPDELLNETLPHLDLLVENDKWVLLTAYTADSAQIENHYTQAIAHGYIPFATVRDLDVLTINSGYEPD